MNPKHKALEKKKSNRKAFENKMIVNSLKGDSRYKGAYPKHKTIDDRSAELHERIQERRHTYGRK